MKGKNMEVLLNIIRIFLLAYFGLGILLIILLIFCSIFYYRREKHK